MVFGLIKIWFFLKSPYQREQRFLKKVRRLSFPFMTFVDVYKIETWNTILQQGFNKQKKNIKYLFKYPVYNTDLPTNNKSN